MNYRHVYMLIIEHAKSEMKNGLRPSTKYQKRKYFSDNYFEFHHILPKSLYPNWKKKKENIVCLTAREHFFCHQLLTKIYPCSNMIYALWLLCNDDQNKTCIKSSRQYQLIREQYSCFLSEKYKGISRNKGLYNSFSDEKKQEILEKRKNTCILNNILPIGEKNGMYGQHWSDHPEWCHPDRKGKNNPNYGNHALSGENNPMFGKHLKDYMSPENYQKWLDSHKGRTKSEESIKRQKESFKKTMIEKGRYEPEETKKEHFKKMVETRKQNGSYNMSREQKLKISKQVKCVEDNLTFDSLNSCGEYYNISNVSRIIKKFNGYAKRINKHFILI